MKIKKLRKQKEGAKYLKRVSTCVHAILSKSITVPSKNMNNKTFAASKRYKVRPHSERKERRRNCKGKFVFVNMVSGERFRCTGGPNAAIIKPAQEPILNKINKTTVIMVAIK